MLVFCCFFVFFFFFPTNNLCHIFPSEEDSFPGTVSLSQVSVGLRQDWASHPQPPPVAVSGISWAVIADLRCNLINNKDFGRLIKMMIYSKTSIEIVSEFQKESSQWNEQKASETKMAGCGLGAAASLGASLEPNAAAVWYECVFSPWWLNNFQFFFFHNDKFPVSGCAAWLSKYFFGIHKILWLIGLTIARFFCLVMGFNRLQKCPRFGLVLWFFF